MKINSQKWQKCFVVTLLNRAVTVSVTLYFSERILVTSTYPLIKDISYTSRTDFLKVTYDLSVFFSVSFETITDAQTLYNNELKLSNKRLN